jgi:hypothetical protein
MGQRNELRKLVSEIESHTGLRVPIRPETLASVLGIKLLPIHGARFTLRDETITYDATLSDAQSGPQIAHGCAAYFLRQAGLLKRTPITISRLAEALCTPSPIALLSAANDE